MSNVDEKIKELTLLLLYLNSWKEGKGDFAYRRSWKGFNFNTLDQLDEEGLIFGSKRAKSVGFSEEGVEEALKLMKKYNIEE